MLGTAPIRQYFSSGTNHFLNIALSTEWNYNLFYPAYATFSGDGTDYSSGIGTWSNGTVASGLGKYGDDCLEIYSEGQTGTTSTTVSVPSGTNTYKVVFYAKVLENQTVTLSCLNYLDIHRSSSTTQQIDSTQWVRFVTYISSRPLDTPYNNFTITLDYTSKDDITPYHILIDMIQIYETTEFDYQYDNLWPTDSPFTFFRPGESYVNSGNYLTPLPSNFRKINTKINSPLTWSNQMPCSPMVYNPQLLNLAASNPLYKNGLLSDYTKYKYFVSDLNTKQIGGFYEQEVGANKIVLKFNVAYAKPSINLNLYDTKTGYSSGNINISYTEIPDSGVVIIYRQSNGSWSLSPWTTMPTFNLQGQITNYQYINKIVVTQTESYLNPNYNSSSEVAKADMQRLHVIEISPRLEIDITNFLMDIDVITELDNKQSPLPISAISANTATIHLANIPLLVSNQVLSLFSNNSDISPLKGLFKKYVKFYINYIVKDSVAGTSTEDRVINGGVYYADSWDSQDIDKTQVTCYDAAKQLQLRSPTDYVAEYQNVFNMISNILDSSGFTDYDYDSLKKVTMETVTLSDGTVEQNSHPVVCQYFYADGSQQKIFDVLREILEVYQIGAYFDSYGVMKFLNLNSILNNTTENLIVHDSTTPLTMVDPDTNQILIVSPNIVTDTYNETIKTKIGQATFKYKTPQISKTLSPSSNGAGTPLTTAIIDKNDALWALTDDDMTTFNYLDQSITSVSQDYFYLNQNDLLSTFNSFDINHNGYAIIEGEIVSFSDKEYLFSVTPGDSVPVTYQYSGNYTAIISNATDMTESISEFANKSGYGGQVTYTPTGKIANVQRGMFNTPVRKHLIVNDSSSLNSRLQLVEGTSPTVYLNQIMMPVTTDGQKTIMKPIDDTNSSNIGYTTFSTKMVIGPNSNNAFIDGAGGGLVINIGGNPIYVEIRQDLSSSTTTNKKGIKVPGYRLYCYQGNTSLFGPDTPYYDISGTLLNDTNSYPPGSPFEEFGRVVNLKFVQTSTSSFELFLNKNRISVSNADGLNLDVFGDYGIFSHGTTGATGGVASGSIAFIELYATQTPLNISDINYHYELPSFANSIVAGHKTFEINYMLQTRPQVVGIQYYDVQYSLAPSINAYPLKVQYSWWYFSDPVNNTTKLNFVTVNEDALNYSLVYNSGFRGRIAIVNSSPSAVWLKKTPDTVNPIDIIFSINSDNIITLGDQQSITKVFDQSGLSDSIEIQSNWVQSRSAADAILSTIFKAIDGFSRDTQISIYGNPLIEIGDVVHIKYSLKNIGINESVSNKYFVESVEQKFDTGLETIITLNQIV